MATRIPVEPTLKRRLTLPLVERFLLGKSGSIEVCAPVSAVLQRLATSPFARCATGESGT